ncbi:hypothetical protein EIN_161690 [Entamoeba invadens IP1]|uniref:Uncharacterized protein n=1 Tax=Entamoeba invadens IP1 TaxID=370355 RepID=A0A0A1U4D1_ENTIV|nr:hypothetical protein EIN_161690 [Entamoeba invadens IP1]ELP86555.1 hypothetical protein EIN_161690 [Entamoeba invadens IP1]|eukprot:XP_004185901.1 hypothetical protein EIN_161690 [Entamoeba invadens IP1]
MSKSFTRLGFALPRALQGHVESIIKKEQENQQFLSNFIEQEKMEKPQLELLLGGVRELYDMSNKERFYGYYMHNFPQFSLKVKNTRFLTKHPRDKLYNQLFLDLKYYEDLFDILNKLAENLKMTGDQLFLTTIHNFEDFIRNLKDLQRKHGFKEKHFVRRRNDIWEKFKEQGFGTPPGAASSSKATGATGVGK